MEVLTGEALAKALKDVPGWHVEGGEITRTVQFGTFPEAIAFVNRVAEVAEELGHHPDMDIRYSKVRVAVVTHDAGGLTGLDFRLALRLNEVVAPQ